MKTAAQLEIKIKRISTEQTYAVRQEVLRKRKPISSCFFEADDDVDTFHLGAFYKKEIIAVATFLKNKNDEFPEITQFQLRGMAVLPQFQKQQIGEKMILEAEDILKNKNVSVLLWFNARKTAKEFYSKYGYQISGKPFEIKEIGTHFLMFKKIK